MIWLIMGIFVLAVLLFVAQPLYVKNAPRVEADSEVKAYLDKIKEIDIGLEQADVSADVSALELAKVELQRQVLAKTRSNQDAGPQTLLLSVLFIAFAFGAMGLYTMVGRPDLSKSAALQKPIVSPEQAMERGAGSDRESSLSLEDAVSQLEKKLAQGDQNPQGWILYARSLMSMRRFDEAVDAYEKVLLLTDNNPNVAEEFASAKAYIAQQKDASTIKPAPNKEPSAEQMRDAAAMTPEDRQAMIEAMVARLSATLTENPNDPEGWVRLLRARKVMGSQDEVKAEMALMRKTFKENPELIKQILIKSGWREAEP